jgi:hypothetical protein
MDDEAGERQTEAAEGQDRADRQLPRRRAEVADFAGQGLEIRAQIMLMHLERLDPSLDAVHGRHLKPSRSSLAGQCLAVPAAVIVADDAGAGSVAGGDL